MPPRRPPRQKPRLLGVPRWLLTAIPVAALLVGAAFSVTALSPSEASKSGSLDTFDATSFASKAFAPVIVPYVKSHAVSLDTLVTELVANKTATETKYGHDSGKGSQFAFPVTTTATAGDVSNGLLALTVAGLPTGYTAYLQVGPAITGSALRDVTGKYPFGAFANQIDYLNASLALNAEAKTQVLASLQPEAIKGKSLIIYGAFLESINPGLVSIVPTSVEVQP